MVIADGKATRSGCLDHFDELYLRLLQCPSDLRRPLRPHRAGADFQIVRGECCGVHIAAPVNEVVSLVHKNDMATTALGEMPLQAGRGIERVIEVADDDVAPG